MLLKSSSTPVLGSLLPSFSESPNHYDTKPTTFHHSHSKLAPYQTGSLNMNAVSCSSSPISPSIDCDRFFHKGFRRAQSEGNLEGLAYASCSDNEDQLCESNQLKAFTKRPKCMTLQTIPSFSFYDSRGVREDEEDDESYADDGEEREEFDENEQVMEAKVVRGGDVVMTVESGRLGLEGMMRNFNIIEGRVKDAVCNVGLEQGNELTQKMYLAKGLGITGGSDRGCGGDGGGYGRGGGCGGGGGGGEDGGDKQGVEEYYKRMVKENPGGSLFLRNYAEFLYECKGDLKGAEEYYSRAILADPKDGDILSQYAKLVWELHHDQDRATSYFERAVQASPQDSHVQAAYANFLWETEDEGEEIDTTDDIQGIPGNPHEAAIASATA